MDVGGLMVMICPHCKKETENVEEMMFEGLTVRPIEQLGVAFKDIVVPSGWRLPTLAEGVLLVNNSNFVKWSMFDDKKHDFYVVQPLKKNEGRYAAWIGCDNGDFFINVYDNLNRDAARGVIFVKNKGAK